MDGQLLASIRPRRRKPRQGRRDKRIAALFPNETRANNSTAIQLWDCNGTSAQSWAWNSGDGTLRVLGKCMDVTGGSTANGTQLQLWDCNGTGAQQWRWRNQNRLVNPQSGRCLDGTGGSTADGTRLQIWDCNGTDAQAWYLP